MAKLKITCPACGAEFAVDEAYLSKTCQCKRCGAKFPIKRPEAADRVEAAATIPAAQSPVAQSTIRQIPPGQPEATQPAEPATPPSDNREIQATIPQTTQERPRQIAAAEADVPAEWNIGDVILDTYEVRKLSDSLDYAQGSFGRVYRVHHRGWNMDLAVKSPLADKFRSEQDKQNFIAECETWIELGLHPNIVSCYYVRTLGMIPRVFAEFVEGGSLEDWIRDEPDGRPGRLYEGGTDKALERILNIAVQFAWGLHYAHEHEQKLVHQDVKPQNVMMTPDGEAKVSDFGLAKARAGAPEPRAGTAAGSAQQSLLVSSGGMTPAYCSPEQANGEPLTRKTDIWSWAVSVLEMFTGEVTWHSGSAAMEALELYLQTGDEDESIPPMPDAIGDLLKHCFQQSTEDRPKDMAEIAGGLKEIYQDVTGQAYPREEPKAAELLADSLNNRAVSMLDLKKKDEAEKLFDEALEADPHHPETTYNRGLILWRAGRIADDELVRQLEEVCQSHPDAWRDEYLLGLVHLERGDGPSAVKVLEQAAQQAGDDTGVESALTAARDCADRAMSRTLEGHTKGVHSVSMSADGRWGLSGSEDKTVRLWDLAAGKCLRIFEGHSDTVCSVSMSADGRWGLSSGGWDTAVRLWDLATGKCQRIFEGHTIKVESVSLSADGRWGLSGSGDGTVRLWDPATGKCLRTFEGSAGTVHSVGLSADGRWGLSGVAHKTVRLWDPATGQCLRTFEGHTHEVLSVSISADGRRGLSGSWDKTFRLWDLATGKCVRIFEDHAINVSSVSLSADGRWGLSGSGDGTVRMWDLTTGKCLRTFEDHAIDVSSVSLSAAGHWGLSGGADKTVRLWDLKTGPMAPFAVALPRGTEEITEHAATVQQTIRTARAALENSRPGEALKKLARARQIHGYERHGELLALWHTAGVHCRTISLRSAWCDRQFKGHALDVSSATISADGRWGLSGSEDKTVCLWDLTTGKCVRTFEGHTKLVNSVSISADGRWGLSGSKDKTLRLWELDTGKCVRTFEGHTSTVNSVSISADGRWGLSVSSRNVTLLWDLAAGKCVRIFGDHTKWVSSVSISADGRWVLSGSPYTTVQQWDLATGQCVRTFEGHTEQVNSVSISADGRWGLSGSDDRTVRLWDLATGQCVRTFEGHTEWVNSVSISADGRWGLSGSGDRTVRLWDLATGKCARTFEGHTHWVSSVSISADGCWGLSGSNDKTLRLWKLDWEYEFPGWADWDEGALPCLETFLTLRCPYGDDGPGRVGKPVWNDEHFPQLIKDLQHRGYGWLRPEGVRKKLEEMTANWTGPPPLPWELPNRDREVHSKPRGLEIQDPQATESQESSSLLKAGSAESHDHGTGSNDPVVTCPKCGAGPCISSLLFGQQIHSCPQCGYQEGVSPSDLLGWSDKAVSRHSAATSSPTPDASALQHGQLNTRPAINPNLLRRIIQEAGDEKQVLQKVMSGWGEGHGSPEARRIYDRYVEALPAGSIAPDLREFVRELLRMVDPIALRLRPEKPPVAPHRSPRQTSGDGQHKTFRERIEAALQAKQEELLNKNRIQGRKVCPCGQTNPPANTFCVACGKHLPAS